MVQTMLCYGNNCSNNFHELSTYTWNLAHEYLRTFNYTMYLDTMRDWFIQKFLVYACTRAVKDVTLLFHDELVVDPSLKFMTYTLRHAQKNTTCNNAMKINRKPQSDHRRCRHGSIHIVCQRSHCHRISQRGQSIPITNKETHLVGGSLVSTKGCWKRRHKPSCFKTCQENEGVISTFAPSGKIHKHIGPKNTF